jgi:hypothetical protein
VTFCRERDDTIELHHGDCVGADAEVAKIASSLGIRIVCHPPIKEDLRAFVNSDETREPFSYFERNRHIVDETELLLVVPYQMSQQTSGGTWYTRAYAVKKNKQVKIFLPFTVKELMDD